jgi:predicted RNA-binding protein with PIN domain
MQYLVDGYNLLFCDFKNSEDPSVDFSQMPLAQARSLMIEKLAMIAKSSGQDLRIVFDAAHTPGDAHWQRHSPIDIIYSPANMSADDFLLECCIGARTYKKSKSFYCSNSSICIVTNDKKLRILVLQEGGKAISFDQFFKKIKKSPINKSKPTKSPVPPQPTYHLSEPKKKLSKWQEHYVAIFEELFNNNH